MLSNEDSWKKNSRTPFVLVITDLFSISLSYGLAILVRTAANPIIQRPLEKFQNYWLLVLFNILIFLLIFALMGLYRGYGLVAVAELRDITKSIIIAYIIFAVSIYLFGEGGRLSRIVFILSIGFGFILIPLFRLVAYNKFSNNQNWGVNVVVIASREEYPKISSKLLEIRRLGFNPVQIYCTEFKKDEIDVFRGISVCSYSPERCHEIRDKGIRIAFYTSMILSLEDKILTEISYYFPIVYYILPESDLSSLWIEATDLSGRPALKVRYSLLEKKPNLIKRLIEVIISVLILIFTSPLSLLMALFLVLEKKGSIFYEQYRYGLNGKIFKIKKFRTMVSNSDTLLDDYLRENPDARQEYDLFHKINNDPRITRIGSIARKFSIDEIPQLLNVISGDMNLIGPRAYMVHEVDILDKHIQTILRVRPGVTGWWQVTGRNDATFQERQRLDLYYISNWSLWLDYYILIKTFWIILNGQGK